MNNISNQQNGKIKSLVSSDAEKDGKQQLGCLFMITGCLNALTPLENTQKKYLQVKYRIYLSSNNATAFHFFFLHFPKRNEMPATKHLHRGVHYSLPCNKGRKQPSCPSIKEWAGER